MDGWRAWNAAWRILLWIGLVALAAWFLWAVRGILLPFVLAFLTAVLVEPSVNWLGTKGVRRGVAVGLVTAGFFLLVGALGFAASFPVGQQLDAVHKRVDETLKALSSVEAGKPTEALDNLLSQVSTFTERFGYRLDRETIVAEVIEPQKAEIAKAAEQFAGGFVSVLSNAFSQVFVLLFTPLFVVMLLSDLHLFREKLRAWVPPSIRESTLNLVSDMGDVFKAYLRGITLSVSIYTLLIGFLLFALGVPFFAVLALLSGAFYLVPVIGGIASGVIVFLAVALSGQTGNAYVTLANPAYFALLVVAVQFVVGTMYDMLVHPRIVGKAVDLHPLVAMFMVFSGGALFGLVGMVLAVPVAGSVKVILERLLNLSTSSSRVLDLPACPLRHRVEV
jgi:predicted PurR-regulated permease PerM